MTEWRNRIIETRTVTASELNANPSNWRRHPDAQARAIRGLLSEVGIVAPLIAYHSARAGGALTLIDGHMRQETGGEWPVTVLDVTDEEADLVLATFDPLSGLAEMDSAALAELLARVEMTPVEDDGVRELLASLAAENVVEVAKTDVDAPAQIDRAAELQQQWGTATGQMWQLGDHRLIVGDCTDADVVARGMGGERAELLFTDPPYGVDVAGGTHDPRDEKNYRSGGVVENDALSDKDLEDLLDGVFRLAKSVMLPGAAYYIWHPSSKVEIFARCVRKYLAPHREIVIWAKENFVFGRQDYHWQHEPAFYGWLSGAHKWVGDRTQSTLWQVEKVGTDLEKKIHPTAKPVGLASKAIENNTDRGSVIYEPFSGSGTTLIACEQLGRKCRAVEISPAYVAVTLQRYLDATGKQPTLLEAA